MPSLDNVIAALRRALHALELASGHAGSAKDQAEEIRDVGEAVGVRSIVERFELVRSLAELCQSMIATGVDLVNDAIDQAEAVRGESPGTVQQAPGPASTPRYQRTAPPHVVHAAADLPERVGDRGPTTGRAFLPDGTALFGGPLVSGHNIASTARLRPVTGGRGWPWTFTDHVEPAVAGRMREPGGPHQVTLVVNKAPCAGDPYGCDRALGHLLPVGHRLTVYVKDLTAPEGVRYHKTYEGTGRAVRP